MGQLLLLLLLLLPLPGLEAQRKKTVRVFIVPHSHMDVAWSHPAQDDMATYLDIYSSAVTALMQAPERRFIVAEQEYFRLWWDNVATAKEKDQVRQLLNQGRLEFVTGGQVMHDEAVTHVDDQILQLTEGHAFLYEALGIRPQSSWQIDPYGASATTPTLFALAGFQAHVISRINYKLKLDMQKAQSLQFVWRGSRSLLETQQEIFTHVMDKRSFCTMSQWNESVLFPDVPSLDNLLYPEIDIPLTSEDLKPMAEKLVKDMKERVDGYQTQHFLWSWGCDRKFFDTLQQFDNMDLIISHINQRASELGVSVEYATLEEYFRALHELRVTWAVRDHRDFLPYSSGKFQAWTGFYASRSGLKALARRASALLYAAESMFVRHLWPEHDSTVNASWALQQLQQLRWAVSEVQHHNAITGTETPKVRDIYVDHLTEGMENVQDVMLSIIKDRGQASKGPEIAGHLVVIYNPLAWNVTTIITLTVAYPHFSLTDDSGNLVPAQMQRSKSPSLYDVHLLITIPGLSYQHYSIRCMQKSSNTMVTPKRYGRKKRTSKGSSDKNLVSVQNDCYTVFLDLDTNLMYSIWEREGNSTVRMTQDFLEYRVNRHTQKNLFSDNFMFTPVGPAQRAWDSVALAIVPGKLLTEIRQYFYSGADKTPTYILYSRVAHVSPVSSGALLCHRLEQELQVGPLKVNREAILRTSTGLDTQKTLYSDNNGYQMQQRTFQEPRENVRAQNYYPMVQSAFIQDDCNRLLVLSDQAHGVSSQDNGQVEVMLHRRLHNTNHWMHSFNLTLNDDSVVNPVFWLLLGPLPLTTALHHQSGLALQHRPVMLLRELRGGKWGPDPRHRRAVTLPPTLHLQLLSIPGWNFSSNHTEHLRNLQEGRQAQVKADLRRVLLRLQHLYEVGEDPVLSQPATVNLKVLLRGLGTVQTVEERSLTGTWAAGSLQRWRWKLQDTHRERDNSRALLQPAGDFEFTIYPKEIRTFFVHFQRE
ncbi:epididymis-specific alpha-mannosidase-like [Sorex fumeus]|uniref:epididymis-specific alpha-mannosidase-like n=1 Tax=Sorex fumeus TaxID=62283 RepID=UPI0024AD686E|nr:epididymis-specific alpha-mannosidase-like [Sorex fumeus]